MKIVTDESKDMTHVVDVVYVVTCVDADENHHIEVFADYDKASAAYSVSLARYGRRASIASRKVIH